MERAFVFTATRGATASAFSLRASKAQPESRVFSMSLFRPSLTRRCPLTATSTCLPLATTLSQPIERQFCLHPKMCKVHSTVYCSTASWLPLPCIHAYRLKDVAHTPRGFSLDALANTHTHNQTQSNSPQCNILRQQFSLCGWLRSDASRACKSSVFARCTRILSNQVDSVF